MTNFAKIEADAVLAKEAADKAWRAMAYEAMSLTEQVRWLSDTARERPSREDMDELFLYLDRYDAAQRECNAKRDANREASRKWVAEAEAAAAQVGRSY